MSSSLVIQAARFGDLVQTRRLLLDLASEGEVHLLVDRSLKQLASIIYPFAYVHGLDFHCRASDLDEGKALLVINRILFAELRGLGIDRVYNLNFSPATAAVCRLFEPDTVIGHRPAPGGGMSRSAWVRLALRLGSRRRLNPLNLVDYWAHFASCHPLDKAQPDNANNGKAALDLLRPVYINPDLACSGQSMAEIVCPRAIAGGKGLGVVLAGRVARRSLPVPLLAAIVQTAGKILQSRQIYLFGTEDERRLASKLIHQLEPKVAKRVVDLCGKTDWSALIDKLAGLDTLISPDTGTMHLAAMLGVPVLGFFLSNAWCHETGPYGQGHMIFQAMPHCAPCLESAPCANKMECLDYLQSSDLLRSVAKCLSGDLDFSIPPGLSCLKSSVDSFGLHYLPVSGAAADNDLPGREFVRTMLCQFVSNSVSSQDLADHGLPVPAFVSGTISPALASELTDWLFPESEWMLPPWRYC